IERVIDNFITACAKERKPREERNKWIAVDDHALDVPRFKRRERAGECFAEIHLRVESEPRAAQGAFIETERLEIEQGKIRIRRCCIAGDDFDEQDAFTAL